MGAAEIGAAAAVVGAGAAVYSASNSGGGGGGGGGGTGGPYNYELADDSYNQWYLDNQQLSNIDQGIQDVAIPAYQQSYDAANNINYDQYLQAANTAGTQMTNLAGAAGQQSGYYGQAADQARQQQSALYSAGNQLYQTSLDPQNALYDRTQQQLTDQVRAGQAARGIGLSGEGAVEENGAMSNFNIDWQNQQLSRQLQGVQGMSSASNAGYQQGQMAGADMAGQLAAGQAQTQYTQEGAQIPLTAQQYVASQPAANANTYATNMGNLSSMWAAQQNQILPFINNSDQVAQYNTGYNTQQNAATAKALTQGVGAIGNAFSNYQSASNPSGWMNNVNTSNGGFGANGADANNMANGGSVYDSYGGTGYDAYYGG